ncbi:Mitochondrial carrier protein [Penicillium cf. griseofulvum]|uniref:Mitochondrial thiamine pyrophosphate carrier 1 n=1 Tax=Penicillium cf. griseofulvum TaxID=2972120 RepID=A0A9W9N1C6_9EURO|nr:Mitochondrial carrier protein [Penicillium cf. griseofulvum]KAJ5422620.1 Mitochondrial carrier protein [Penicillium cf. griseofulvum]KAJ5428797.1 Mitochondrial carrier protein [Penicillium cf. griseofulvum]
MKDTGISAPIATDLSTKTEGSHHVYRIPKSNEDSQNLDFALRNGLAGGVAGCAAKTIVAPLERIRILFQTSHSEFVQYSTRWDGLIKAARDIRTSYGIPALFKGHSASLVRVFPYAGINFLAYEHFRAAFIASPEKEAPWRRFLCGSMAGATSSLVTYPLELIRTRLAFETVQKNPSSWVGISKKIYFEGAGNGSLLNLYCGITPTMLGILPYAGTSFLTHDLLRDWLRSPALAPYTLEAPSSTRLTAVAQLSCGAVAGIIAQTISYPIDIIRRRMQVGNVVNGQRGILETAQCIFLERGVRGFYVGLTIGYVKMAPMVATSFYVYDRMKRYLGLIE